MPTPRVGEIRVGGGVAEQYLGGGAWRRFREDERECVLMRYGQPHEEHEHIYWYTRPEDLGGITRGTTFCQGLTIKREPYPLLSSMVNWRV